MPLTQRQRNRIPLKFFAFPTKRKYPVQTKQQALAAFSLARLHNAQGNLSDKDLDKVVYLALKYHPSIAVGADGRVKPAYERWSKGVAGSGKAPAKRKNAPKKGKGASAKNFLSEVLKRLKVLDKRFCTDGPEDDPPMISRVWSAGGWSHGVEPSGRKDGKEMKGYVFIEVYPEGHLGYKYYGKGKGKPVALVGSSSFDAHHDSYQHTPASAARALDKLANLERKAFVDDPPEWTKPLHPMKYDPEAGWIPDWENAPAKRKNAPKKRKNPGHARKNAPKKRKPKADKRRLKRAASSFTYNHPEARVTLKKQPTSRWARDKAVLDGRETVGVSVKKVGNFVLVVYLGQVGRVVPTRASLIKPGDNAQWRNLLTRHRPIEYDVVEINPSARNMSKAMYEYDGKKVPDGPLLFSTQYEEQAEDGWLSFRLTKRGGKNLNPYLEEDVQAYLDTRYGPGHARKNAPEKRKNPGHARKNPPKRRKLWSQGNWAIYLLTDHGSGKLDEAASFMIVGEGPRTFHTDYPIVYESGSVAYDRPESVPKSVQRAFLRIADKAGQTSKRKSPASHRDPKTGQFVPQRKSAEKRRKPSKKSLQIGRKPSRPLRGRSALSYHYKLRERYGDNTVTYYDALIEAVADGWVSGVSIVGPGSRNPKKAAVKWLEGQRISPRTNPGHARKNVPKKRKNAPKKRKNPGHARSNPSMTKAEFEAMFRKEVMPQIFEEELRGISGPLPKGVHQKSHLRAAFEASPRGRALLEAKARRQGAPTPSQILEVHTRERAERVPDVRLREQEWHNYVDELVTLGELSERAYDWTIPSWLETLRAPRTLAEDPSTLHMLFVIQPNGREGYEILQGDPTNMGGHPVEALGKVIERFPLSQEREAMALARRLNRGQRQHRQHVAQWDDDGYDQRF